MNDETASELTPLKTSGGIPAILVRKVSDVLFPISCFQFCTVHYIINKHDLKF